MNITIVGTGYVGLTSGVCFAELGHSVTCVDIDEKKIAHLSTGACPIYEEGLSALLEKNLRSGTVRFTSSFEEGMRHADVVFFCVDTPPGEYGKANLAHLLSAVHSCAQNLNTRYVLFVNKSTAPVGTAATITETIRSMNESASFGVASNPEFLQEGSAVANFMNPDRIVIGVQDERGHELLHECYHTLVDRGVPLLATRVESAELIKYAANSFLALKISFINEVADFAEQVGADITDIAKGIGLDKRIGHRFLEAGIGYGGSCFGKDVKALDRSGEEHGFEFKIIKALATVNDLRYQIIFKKLKKHLGDLKYKRIAVLGLSFKPNTDDVRDSPALRIVHELVDAGARVTVTDPVALEKFKTAFSRNGDVAYAETAYEASGDQDAIVVLTAWREYTQLDLTRIKESMSGALIVDGRNIFDRKQVEEMGFVYEGVGR